MQKMFNKDLEEIKNKLIMNNVITEIKNTLEETNSRITEAEDRISRVEDRMLEINEAERKKEKKRIKEMKTTLGQPLGQCEMPQLLSHRNLRGRRQKERP